MTTLKLLWPSSIDHFPWHLGVLPVRCKLPRGCYEDKQSVNFNTPSIQDSATGRQAPLALLALQHMFLINCIYCSSVHSIFSLQNQTSRIANHLRCRVQPVRAPTDRQAEQYDRFADPPAEEFARHGHSGHAGGVQKCRPTVRCDRYRHHRADLYSLRAYTGKCVGVWRLFLFLFCIVYVAVAIVVNQLPFSLLPEMRSHENDWFLVASGRWIFFSPVTPAARYNRVWDKRWWQMSHVCYAHDTTVARGCYGCKFIITPNNHPYFCVWYFGFLTSYP